MIKNMHYSYDYSQPEEYRFSLDSVFLAQSVAASLKDHPSLGELSLLDLCSGVGVIGLELAFHLPDLRQIDFLEVQECYRPHFEHNVKQAERPLADFRFLPLNYKDLLKRAEYREKYDIIVSNPPYFFPGEGLLSPSRFKNRCRFFLDGTFDELIESILFSLKSSGKAYLLARSGTHHGRDVFLDVQKKVAGLKSVSIAGHIRGTDVLEIAPIP